MCQVLNVLAGGQGSVNVLVCVMRGTAERGMGRRSADLTSDWSQAQDQKAFHLQALLGLSVLLMVLRSQHGCLFLTGPGGQADMSWVLQSCLGVRTPAPLYQPGSAVVTPALSDWLLIHLPCVLHPAALSPPP